MFAEHAGVPNAAPGPLYLDHSVDPGSGFYIVSGIQSPRVTCPRSHSWYAFTQSLWPLSAPLDYTLGSVALHHGEEEGHGTNEMTLGPAHHLTTTQASRGRKVDSQNTKNTRHVWLLIWGPGSIDMSGEAWTPVRIRRPVLGTIGSHRRPSPGGVTCSALHLEKVLLVTGWEHLGVGSEGKLGDRAASERGGWLEETRRHGYPRWDGRGQRLCRSSEEA